jgi:G:T-mismatch repair DNA endonuclease (very short patch repair protein)
MEKLIKNKDKKRKYFYNVNLIKKVKSYEEIYGKKKAEKIKKQLSIKHSGKGNPFYGHQHPNKGKTGLYKHSKERIKKIKEARKNQINTPENNPEIGKKISKALKGKTYEELYGSEKAKEIKEKRSQFIKNQYKQGTKNLGFPKDGTMKEARKKQIFPLKDTKIEVKLQNYLKQLGIKFITHQYIDIKYGYQADILIPVQQGIDKKIVIEADGDYWHGNTKIYNYEKMPKHIKEQIPLDIERTVQLKEAGFDVLRLWENEINKMSIDEFKFRVYNITPLFIIAPIKNIVNSDGENIK